MKRHLTFYFFLAFPFLLFAQKNIDSLLKVLDKTVDNYQLYSNQKEKKLDILKKSLKSSSTDFQKFSIYSDLFNNYKTYRFDSTLIYARKMFSIAKKLNNKENLAEARLKMAEIMLMSGMYKDAIDILNKVKISDFPNLRMSYYQIYKSVYLFMAENTVPENERIKYILLSNSCNDSTLIKTDIKSIDYILAKTIKFNELKKYDEALNLLLNYHSGIIMDTHTMAVTEYYIASVYHRKNERELEKYWFILSAINDLKSANKEYISLLNVAYFLYEDGSINRAYNYIKRSLEDALFCNARLKTYEISKILPIIDKAYQIQTEARKKQLIRSLIYISILSLLLLIAIFFIYLKMKKLSIARKELSIANGKLQKLNYELSDINHQLNNTNETLKDANLIKENYIGSYMDQCSEYIDKLDNYRRTLNRSATSGNMDELLHNIKSKKFIEDELKEFYSNFDMTFLELFPHFVEDFNALLIDNEEIQLKQGELLNTELRIFALIRLGITDSLKISHFLRYSLSTIYNYRTKFRNKAAGSRDEFEAKVIRIGTITKKQ